MTKASAGSAPLDQAWQLEDSGPEAYERFLVPAFFTPCAELVAQASAIVPGARVLDLACGTGVVARTIAARVGPMGTIVGSDKNSGMLRVAESVARDVVPPISWIEADAASLPMESATFDVVCCQQGLQFFPDAAAALREAQRVLAPHGRLVLAIWRPVEHNSLFGPLIEALRVHLGEEAAGIMRGPFAGRPLDELRTILAGAGFERVRATIEIVRVRFPSVDEFLRREISSSPLRGLVDALSPPARDAFGRDVRGRLEPWVDDLGLAFTMETWIVVADGQA